MRATSLIVGALVSLAGCGEDDKLCGPGTVEQNGVCLPAFACGDGTVEREGQCVPAEDGAAPTVTAISPGFGLLGGGNEFTIEGTGFAAHGAGETTVLFGETPAVFEIVSDTQLRGTVPRGTARVVDVTVANQHGAAGTTFRYTGMYAADGRSGEAGNLYVFDPRDGTTLTIGRIEDAKGTGYAITGLAFDGSGVLYATETQNSEGGSSTTTAKLLRIDPATAVATVVGLLNEDVGKGAVRNHTAIADIGFSGTTLVGWTEAGDAPASIDTTTGAVTVLGPGTDSAGSGIATLPDGTTLVAPGGPRGALWSVNLSDGVATSLVPLVFDLALENVNLCALESVGTAVFGLICIEDGANTGSALAAIDTASGKVTVLTTAPPSVDAIAAEPGLVIPAGVANTALTARLAQLAACSKHEIALTGARTGRITAGELAASPGSIGVKSKRAGVRGLALDAVASGDVLVSSCGDAPTRFTRAELADYALVSNQRGTIKLVNRHTGRAVLKNVTGLRVE